VELLEIAEKRTAGAWSVVPFGNYDEYKIEPEIFTGEPVEATGMTLGDATFVASCGTGAAEAGWLATIAAIDAIFNLSTVTYGWDGDCGSAAHADTLADSVTSAWFIELLNNK
jgi:hypothetical protein